MIFWVVLAIYWLYAGVALALSLDERWYGWPLCIILGGLVVPLILLKKAIE